MRAQWLLLSAAAILTAATLPSGARAQAPAQATVEAKAKTGQKAVNGDLMGKQGLNAGGAKAATAAPEAKGGPKTRGAQGTIRVDNRTNWYIDVYVDRQYRGQVGPWGDIYLYNPCGVTRLYAEAPGTDYYWGPQSGDFCSTTWTLAN